MYLASLLVQSHLLTLELQIDQVVQVVQVSLLLPFALDFQLGQILHVVQVFHQVQILPLDLSLPLIQQVLMDQTALSLLFHLVSLPLLHSKKEQAMYILCKIFSSHMYYRRLILFPSYVLWKVKYFPSYVL